MAKPPRLTDLETDPESRTPNSELSPPPVIPPGVEAKVRVDYTTRMLPAEQAAERYSDDLRDLASDVDDARPVDLPFDPVTQFCAEWRNYAGWLLKVTRLPDPATRRMAGQSYNRTCLEIESLGSIPFDPANLEGVLQIINGNSGGVFRVWLVDQNGQPVPEAFLDRVAIGDPPQQFRQQQPSFDPRYAPARETAPPSKPEPTALELRMADLQERLLSNALERLMQPPPTAVAASSLTDEDKLTLLLVKEGGILTNVVSKIAALAGSPEAAVAKETLGERALNAGLRIAETNPAIVERISGTLERIMNRVLPDPRAPVTVAHNLQQPQRPALQTPHSELSSENSELQTPDSEPNEPAEDDDIMDIIESLFTLLSDTRPFSVDDPVFIELRAQYPIKFRGAMQMIATQPLDGIIAWLSEQSALYESLLAGPVTGPHYRGRLEALQTFCRTPNSPTQAPSSELRTPNSELPDLNESANETS